MSDFTISDQGTIVSFVPNTEEAREWVRENLALEPWQWMGNAFHVDARPAYEIIEAIEREGLTVEN